MGNNSGILPQMNFPLLHHFKPEEFVCKCGCGRMKMDGDLLRILDCARDISGIPYIITSGFRCPSHNKNVGSTSTSSHLSGLAVDIFANDDRKRGAILMGLINAGFRRIGIRKDFIHVDVDGSKPSGRCWLY